MNDVLNTRDQAAGGTVSPGGAWAYGRHRNLLHLLIDYGSLGGGSSWFRLPALVHLVLISDIDSPRGGVTRVRP
jgi:hypothetical protein